MNDGAGGAAITESTVDTNNSGISRAEQIKSESESLSDYMNPTIVYTEYKWCLFVWMWSEFLGGIWRTLADSHDSSDQPQITNFSNILNRKQQRQRH